MNEHRLDHKVLIVDDEEHVGKTIQRALTFAGIDWRYAETADAALEMMNNTRHVFSLILSDQRMPGMQGTEFLEVVKQISPDTVRFLLTAYSDMETITSSVNKGSVHRFILKPWDNDVLLDFISQGLKQFEAAMESDRLFSIAKKQNKELYRLDKALVETTRKCRRQIDKLNLQIKKIEKQIRAIPAPSEIKPEQVMLSLQSAASCGDDFDLKKFDALYAGCLRMICLDFDELAEQSGF